MSSQRGNAEKKGPPKHQNRHKFRNDMHDNTKKMQLINSISVTGCCARCKEVIEWKIKYKKYKPLTQAKTCVRCRGKTVKRAYYTVCDPCAKEHDICTKCGQQANIVLPPELSAAEQLAQQSQLQQELKFLTERKRRAFLRAQESGKLHEAAAAGGHEAGDAEGSDDDAKYSDEEDHEDTDEENEDKTVMPVGLEPAIAASTSSSGDGPMTDANLSHSHTAEIETAEGSESVLDCVGELTLADEETNTSTGTLESTKLCNTTGSPPQP